jgi:alginate lyase
MSRIKLIATSAGVAAVLVAGTAGVTMAAGTTSHTAPTASAPGERTASSPTSASATASSSGGVKSADTSSAQVTKAAHTVKATNATNAATTNNAVDTAQTAATTSPISLSSWAGLVLPVNDSGELSGNDSMVLSPARLDSPWLTQTSTGGLLFWAPSGAATTAHSLHSRTELESAIKYDIATHAHALTATVEVEQLPKSNPEICIAQLHAGGTGGSDPFVMVDFKSGKLYVMVASGTSVAASFYTLLTDVPLDAAFSYRVADNGNGTLTIGANASGQSKSYTVSIPTVLRGVSGHFSAGDYEQGEGSTGSTDGGKVLFTALNQT